MQFKYSEYRDRLGFDDSTDRPSNSDQQAYLISAFMTEDLFYTFSLAMHRLTFERRKSSANLLCATLRWKPANAADSDQSPMTKHIFNERPECLIALCTNYDYNECALHTGIVLQEAFKCDSLAALILYDEPTPDEVPRRGLMGVDPNKQATGHGVFWRFFKWIDRASFEASASAFESFRVLLTTHKGLVMHFLRTNAPLFFHRYHTILMCSHSYVTKRQSIKLMADILLDRTHYDLMTGYVKDPENLKLAMNLLRDTRRMIAYEAFHIFKIFVADPEKSYGVQKILIMNKARLLGFLSAFLAERNEESQFNDEKAYCTSVIEGLPEKVPDRESFGGWGGGARRSVVSGGQGIAV